MTLYSNHIELNLSQKKQLLQFQKNFQLSFQNISLLELALTHTSYANENRLYLKEHKNNERLEFLGDAVLDLIITEYLYEFMDFANEGELAKARSAIVCEQALSKIAFEIKLGSFLFLGKGEEKSGGRERKSLLADAFEALIGAIYLDAGFEKARGFVLTFMKETISQVLDQKNEKDYKTLLQEFVQKTYQSTPSYHLVSESGPDHNKSFFIQVLVDTKYFGPVKGKNKKEAEQAAAKLASEFFHLI